MGEIGLRLAPRINLCADAKPSVGRVIDVAHLILIEGRALVLVGHRNCDGHAARRESRCGTVNDGA
ncbi:MAG: hypothetical protein ACRBCJ_14440 [Hyphomicrobiaceae bacterium]